MQNIRDILDEEFDRLSRERGEKYGTQREQHKLLSDVLSESQFSRFLRGETSLSDNRINRIAKLLRGNTPEASALAERLREASRGPARSRPTAAMTVSIERAHGFFERLAREGALLCVEFRELPRAGGSSGKYPGFLKDAGKAIAKGLNFALFQPFGQLEENPKTDFACPADLWQYLQKLRNSVHKDRQQLWEAAEEAAGGEQYIRGHVALYERSGKNFLGAGVQTRMFFIEFSPSSPAARIEQEVWEWVAVARDEGIDDIFVKRDGDAVPADIVAQQFYPVISYWKEKGHIPTKQTEMPKPPSDRESQQWAWRLIDD